MSFRCICQYCFCIYLFKYFVLSHTNFLHKNIQILDLVFASLHKTFYLFAKRSLMIPRKLKMSCRMPPPIWRTAQTNTITAKVAFLSMTPQPASSNYSIASRGRLQMGSKPVIRSRKSSRKITNTPCGELVVMGLRINL